MSDELEKRRTYDGPGTGMDREGSSMHQEAMFHCRVADTEVSQHIRSIADMSDVRTGSEVKSDSSGGASEALRNLADTGRSAEASKEKPLYKRVAKRYDRAQRISIVARCREML